MQEQNLKVWLILAISAWVIILQQVNAVSDVTFDLETASKTKYNTFLSDIRTKVKDPKLVYEGIPMLPPPTTPTKYILIDLKAKQNAATTITVTLALSRNDLYVVAFTDQTAPNLRAHYFAADITPATVRTLFPTATELIPIGYGSSYQNLEGNAGILRENLQLGFQPLKQYMVNVYGKSIQATDYRKNEAKFLLTTIQMVAEAARFKYIEGKAINSFIPDYKVPSLETNWEKISKAIRSAVKKFTPPIALVYANNTAWVITQVSDIKPDLGLLKYVP
ncbi:hypothetical protein SOVF_110520 [Spinacia oleracea]|uniref:rRNA N-glycosylase n=1 Tax=Spinacia oleracea TaxID=3562 RepID=A0A9R0I3R2_SPIOL|nr:protein synthesis inhibitor PD-S2 [Spinacia oleracea]KNA14122.1 hypothetical protein SOVF_110520 [Spinacia oleracea]